MSVGGTEEELERRVTRSLFNTGRHSLNHRVVVAEVIYADQSQAYSPALDHEGRREERIVRRLHTGSAPISVSGRRRSQRWSDVADADARP
jgi:hypothetical protein